MSEQHKCKYCGNVYEGDTEHVFPRGLGGQDLYMDCVCKKCNGYFSGLERELYQKSYIGMLRSTMGIEGYKPNKRTPAPFKAPIQLTFDEENEIIYEVGQYAEMRTFIRPQFILIDGKYYIEGDTNESMESLSQALLKWKKTNLQISKTENGAPVYVEYQYIGSSFKACGTNIEVSKKNAIKYFSLPETHKLYPFLSPRVFLADNNKDLKIRAKTYKDAVDFMEGFLNHTQLNNSFDSYGNKDLSSQTIYVGFDFDQLKFEQALIKIGLNSLMYYYPATKSNLALDSQISFVNTGIPKINAFLDKKDSIRDSNEGTHNIFFYQLDKSLVVRISLFNGQFVFSFVIDDLQVLKHNEYNRLVIDYKNRLNRFEDQTAFFQSFQTG